MQKGGAARLGYECDRIGRHCKIEENEKKKQNAEDTNWWETSGTNQDKRTLMQTSETT